METMKVNNKEYSVIKLLGKGKGGYSYLVSDGRCRYVLKQIHHEPCDYYQFGNKLEAEINDYKRLKDIGIRIPAMLDVDMENEQKMRENAYLSRTVEIQENQKVIDIDLYGVVRHPMYFATTLLFLSFPLVLGSGVAFVIFLFYPLILVKRIKNEEEVLEKGLEGYKEYKEKVKYRMIPFVW